MGISERELVYEDSLIKMYWDDKSKCVEIEANGTPPPGQYKAAMEKVLELVKRKGASKILADATHLGKISGDDMVWIETEWIPSLPKAGVKRIALVPPKELASYLSIEKMATDMAKGGGGFDRRFFSDPEEARKWLTS